MLVSVQQTFRFHCAAAHLHPLMARLTALLDLHIAQRNLEAVRDKAQQRFVGTAFDGRSREADFQRIAMQTGDLAVLGARLHMQHQREGISFAAMPHFVIPISIRR